MSYKLYDILLNSIQMNGSKIDCIFIHISQNDFQDGPIDSITDYLNICIQQICCTLSQLPSVYIIKAHQVNSVAPQCLHMCIIFENITSEMRMTPMIKI